MKARTRIATLSLALIVCGLLFYGYWGTGPGEPAEPMYRGKPLSAWIGEIRTLSSMDPAPKHVVEALHAIGPAALPFMAKWLQEPQKLTGLASWMSRVGIRKRNSQLRPMPISTVTAFRILGPDARAAIPDLAKILVAEGNRDGLWNHTRFHYAAEALSSVGPEAVPTLVGELTNSRPTLRLEIVYQLAMMGTNAEAAIPALIGCSGDTDQYVRTCVMFALGEIAQRPNQSIPVLLNALKDTSPMVRRDAATALGEFGGQSALDALVSAADDVDGDVRRAVSESLMKIDPKRLEAPGKSVH